MTATVDRSTDDEICSVDCEFFSRCTRHRRVPQSPDALSCARAKFFGGIHPTDLEPPFNWQRLLLLFPSR
jgi:hypothetical protein